MVDAFTPGKADLKRLSPEDLLISSVLQKALVEVTEEGTEAAAATVVHRSTPARAPSSPHHRAGRPSLPLLHPGAPHGRDPSSANSRTHRTRRHGSPAGAPPSPASETPDPAGSSTF